MKNVRFNQRLLSLLTAGVLFGTPVAASASSPEEETKNEIETSVTVGTLEGLGITRDNSDIKVYAQEYVFTPFNTVENDNLVEKTFNVVSEKVSYQGDLRRDIQCLVYVVNRKYMTKEDANVMMNSIVFGDTSLEGEFANIPGANRVLNVLAVYNQRKIKEEGSTIEDLIDPSIFCYGEEDIKLVHDMFVHYYEAYKDSRNRVNDRDDYLFSFMNEEEVKPYTIIFRQLTNSSLSQFGIAKQLSVGARWLVLKTVGGGVMQLLRDYMGDKFTFKELIRYFKVDELKKQQWILTEGYDEEIDPLCPQGELEVLVSQFGQLWVPIYDDIYNDLYETFSINCGNTK